ncbi:NAD(P)-dependent oxidoreductase [Chelatococcus reniformis]|uniref:Hydroxyacid dehydrogenase n=1 Tax=Chelatococcus reniformis TaxID=1494448 RepID=A0A916UBH3_9HYPH|nr:NAD(P)-dependent oxidoreductase [Chelatococcus reniformis]GGC65690.1 hydroxyacid dehydrogenase [Chelatococcus reniformis]
MSKRIVVCSPIMPAQIAGRLGEIPGLEVGVAKPGELPQAAQAADGLVLLGLSYTAALAEALRRADCRCRWLQLLTAGYEPLVEHGVPERVVVCNAGDVWSPIVAEHTMALLLALVRRLREIEAAQQRAAWDLTIRARMDMLYGGHLLIVGMGSIGAEVAQRARPFGMRVTGVSRAGRPHPLADTMLPLTRLHEGLAEADAVVIAVPYSAETHHMIGARELAACRPGAVLVNVARGGVVDPVALLAALEGGTVAGAGLDVTEPEPLPPESPLWRLPNVIVSPHLGGAAPERYYARLVDQVAVNADAFVHGRPLRSQISW